MNKEIEDIISEVYKQILEIQKNKENDARKFIYESESVIGKILHNLVGIGKQKNVDISFERDATTIKNIKIIGQFHNKTKSKVTMTFEINGLNDLLIQMGSVEDTAKLIFHYLENNKNG
jgi:hypothetical protein